MCTLEPRHVVQRRDKGQRGHGTNRRHRRESHDNRVLPREPRESRVGRGDLALQRAPHGDQRRERGVHGGRHREHRELGDGLLGLPAREPEALAADGRLDQGDVARARAHQGVAHGELGAELLLRVARPVHGAVGAQLQRLAQRAGVALVGLHALGARGVHCGEPGIGDDHRMAERFQVPCDPLALGRRLEEDARGWSCPQHGGEALARGDDALLEELAVLRDRAQLALALVEIDPYAIHGWPPGWLLRH